MPKKKGITPEELINKIHTNLQMVGYDDVLSIYNDTLGMGCPGKKLKAVWPGGADEPVFVEEEE